MWYRVPERFAGRRILTHVTLDVSASCERVFQQRLRRYERRRWPALHPLQKAVDDRRQGIRRNYPRSRRGKELLVAGECLVFVGTQIVLATVERDVPNAARGAVPGLGKLFHR